MSLATTDERVEQYWELGQTIEAEFCLAWHAAIIVGFAEHGLVEVEFCEDVERVIKQRPRYVLFGKMVSITIFSPRKGERRKVNLRDRVRLPA